MFDYLIVGSGLAGATFAALAKRDGKKVLVVEKRKNVGGNIRTERVDNIDVHLYGAHIFHTSDEEVYSFFTSFCHLNNFINSPKAIYKGKLYSMPFNMNTFYALWGTKTPEEARAKVLSQVMEAGIQEPKNLEEQALSLVGRDVYMTLIKGYTEKQWGRDCKDLPASIIKRLPLRFVYNNNYFNDKYQGIPIDGYTKAIENMLNGVEVRTSTHFLAHREELAKLARKVVYTGTIDSYFGYQLGSLQYRTLRFVTQRLEMEDFQGNAVINYTEREVPYTRIIEHKHFNPMPSKVTYVTKEYPKEFEQGDEPFYPISNERNSSLYTAYREKAKQEKNVLFAGRLGQYRYFDMDDTIRNTMDLYRAEKN
jgi:UDP-galactopyranose mutase